MYIRLFREKQICSKSKFQSMECSLKIHLTLFPKAGTKDGDDNNHFTLYFGQIDWYFKEWNIIFKNVQQLGCYVTHGVQNCILFVVTVWWEVLKLYQKGKSCSRNTAQSLKKTKLVLMKWSFCSASRLAIVHCKVHGHLVFSFLCSSCCLCGVWSQSPLLTWVSRVWFYSHQF